MSEIRNNERRVASGSWVSVPSGPPRRGSVSTDRPGPSARPMATVAPRDRAGVSAEARGAAGTSSARALGGNIGRALAAGLGAGTAAGMLSSSSNPMLRGARGFFDGPASRGVSGGTALAPGRTQIQGATAVADTSLLGGMRRGFERMTGSLIRNGGEIVGALQSRVLGDPEGAAQTRAFTRPIANALDPRPPAATPGSDTQAPSRRANGVPEELDRHSYGPPATPNSRITEADLGPDGQPRTGRLPGSDQDGDSHDYSVRNALPAGLTREQATEIFRSHRAPTTDALFGRGMDPNVREGDVDARASMGSWMNWVPEPLRSAASLGHDRGGHVNMTQGQTPDGMPWAINSTVDDRHPLAGHITRTLQEHNGRYYIMTQGQGAGDDSTYGARHFTNNLIGPSAFNSLDEQAAVNAQRLLRGER